MEFFYIIFAFLRYGFCLHLMFQLALPTISLLKYNNLLHGFQNCIIKTETEAYFIISVMAYKVH